MTGKRFLMQYEIDMFGCPVEYRQGERGDFFDMVRAYMYGFRRNFDFGLRAPAGAGMTEANMDDYIAKDQHGELFAIFRVHAAGNEEVGRICLMLPEQGRLTAIVAQSCKSGFRKFPVGWCDDEWCREHADNMTEVAMKMLDDHLADYEREDATGFNLAIPIFYPKFRKWWNPATWWV